MARAYLKHKDNRLLFASDEQLALGFIAGILEGTDVVFLTRDPVTMDQFSKLSMLIGSDYVAAQYALRYPTAFDEMPVKRLQNEGKDNSVSDKFGISAIMKAINPLEIAMPKSPYLLNFHCWLIGESHADKVQFAATTFCAERGMFNLLKTKELSIGRNVNLKDRRNIRCNTMEMSNSDAIVSIWLDRMIPYGSAGFPADARLTHGITELAAVEQCNLFMNQDPIGIPWVDL